jgi:hypothetical protein
LVRRCGGAASPPPNQDAPVIKVQDRIFHLLAQDCILLYRGFAIQAVQNPASIEISAFGRMQFGDMADLEICATKNFVLHRRPFSRGLSA